MGRSVLATHPNGNGMHAVWHTLRVMRSKLGASQSLMPTSCKSSLLVRSLDHLDARCIQAVKRALKEAAGCDMDCDNWEPPNAGHAPKLHLHAMQCIPCACAHAPGPQPISPDKLVISSVTALLQSVQRTAAALNAYTAKPWQVAHNYLYRMRLTLRLPSTVDTQLDKHIREEAIRGC